MTKFLGEYTARAAESASVYLLSDETKDARARAKRQAAEALLARPINTLISVPEIEMAMVRDAIWASVQDFRLPSETQLLDGLYEEFGDEPFLLLLPSKKARSRRRMRSRVPSPHTFAYSRRRHRALTRAHAVPPPPLLRPRLR